ncbi:MAG: cytosolic protein [bacterium]
MEKTKNEIEMKIDKEEKKEERDGFDEGWKEIMELYFPQLMEFFFIEIYNDLALEKGYEFLDKELQKIVKDSEVGKRYADKLIKVFLKNGHEKWILIHVDIQGYYDKEFARRMYTYNYRIFDRYEHDVVSLAILADDNDNFQPDKYEVKYWGFNCLFKFPIVKLLDYLNKWEELERSNNPFAIVVMAHLKSIQTGKDSDERLFWKITLVKKLYEKGFSKEDILNLYRFIDWVISLPMESKITFNDEIKKYEEGKKMPFITTAESIGIEKGMEKGLVLGLYEAIDLGLKLKFGFKGLKLIFEVKKIKEVEKLRVIIEAIEIAKEVSEIERFLKETE